MDTIVSGIVLAFVLFGCAILLRGLPTRSGKRPARIKRIVVGALLASSLLILMAALASPYVHTVPNSVVNFVERVVPKTPALRRPFHYGPTAKAPHDAHE